MDGLVAELTGTVITVPEVSRTRGGLDWMRFSVAGDWERGESIRVSFQGAAVPDLARKLAVGVTVFCRGGLKLRHWKTPAGVARSGLSLTAQRIEVIPDEQAGEKSYEI